MQTAEKQSNEASGYLSRTYALALEEFGTPRYLADSSGWIIEREIPGSEFVDGLGCYPLFCCKKWDRVGNDLKTLQSDLVSLSLVADPFGSYNLSQLEREFDRVVQFKDHYVVDMSVPLAESIKRSHQATVRRALNKVEVRVCPNPVEYLDKWIGLYSILMSRHGIKGLRAFSRDSFLLQLQTPGLVMFEALVDGETAGLDLWYVQENVAYGHLVAFNDIGYKSRASYATKWTMLNYFKDKVRWVDLGGTPGAASSSSSGLDSFKSGWATGTKPSYLCGAIFDAAAYEKLTIDRAVKSTEYFPAYRDGEFA